MLIFKVRERRLSGPAPRRAHHAGGAAAQALSETLWEALQEELADPRSGRVAELSERLGEVAAVVASLAHMDARAREPRVGRATYEEPQGPPVAEPASPWEPPETDAPPEPHTPPGSPVPAVLIDELAAAESPPYAGAKSEPPREPPAPPFAGTQPARPDTGARPHEGDPPRKARPEIEIRDERTAEGPAAWIDSIGRRLERHEQDRSPFAVLLVELVDLERLRHAEPAEELSRLTDQVEDALARELRPADSLTRERPGRYWLLAPQTDGPGAQLLVERIARAVRSSASHRGTPLEVAVGVAVCPEDGLRASELAAHADIGLYAARAAGRFSIG